MAESYAIEIRPRCTSFQGHSFLPWIYSPAKIHQIQAGKVVDYIENNLAYYNQHIVHLQNVLRSVERERDKMLEHRYKWKCTTSVVKKVPVAMLTDIFTLLCDEQRYVYHPFNHWQNPVVGLSHVCRQWRTILLSSRCRPSTL